MKCLEDNSTFNAGHGAVFNKEGEIEMDAFLMDGTSLNYGSVAAVQNISNPISLARMVMEKTDHVMLVGKGANHFAKEMGVPEVDPAELVSEVSKQQFAEFSKFREVVQGVFIEESTERDTSGDTCTHSTDDHDTVGAVAIDLKGNIAAGTSTGGITLKRVGRVGDSPLVGCGGYADSKIGGISCTGHGESFARLVLAHRAILQLESSADRTAQMVLEGCLEHMLKQVGGRGGMTMISSKGEIAKCFSTQRMCWASKSQSYGLASGIEGPKVNI